MLFDDASRPPVLAHQRFSADRASFVGLTLQQRFQRIHDTNLWGAALSVSGLGSEPDATVTLRVELPTLLQRLKVTSLLDAPCGDAGRIGRAKLGVSVTGIDIVPDLVDALRARQTRRDFWRLSHRPLRTIRYRARGHPVPRLPDAFFLCQYRA